MADHAARSGAASLPRIVEAAGRGMAAVEEASRGHPRAALRSFTAVAVVAIVALWTWASWFAPWARSSPAGAPAAPAGHADPLLAPATRGDVERAVQGAMAPLRAAVDGLSGRVDRLYERLPAGR